ncbi:hypothetical protein KTH_63150 [Thermosporothrix hazakensis]|nr:hypothetical protein KTH_63150 [Thermosporothrix hazakensis]
MQWLILNQGKLFSADQLIDLFWKDLPADTAMKNLHVTIHYLRRLLEPDLIRGQKSSYIRRDEHNFYWLEKNSSWWTDVCAVEHLSTQARQFERQGNLPQTEAHYRKVVEYCEPGFMPEAIYEDCFQPFRSQYEHLFLEALRWLIVHCQEKNELDEALGYAYQALHLNPYYEQAIYAIATVYTQRGNVAAALRCLEDYQAKLERDLGVSPGQELERLRLRILQGREIKASIS